MRVTDWQTTLCEQLTDCRNPWVVLEGQGMVEAALAGWWEVAGVMISEAHSWEVPVWSGMEVARMAPAELDRLADVSIHGGVLGLPSTSTFCASSGDWPSTGQCVSTVTFSRPSFKSRAVPMGWKRSRACWSTYTGVRFATGTSESQTHATSGL